MYTEQYDVVVVGGGNAGLCAAMSAREAGGRVLVLERGSEADRGGNSAFTGGLFRAPYRGLDDLRELMPDLSDAEIENVDFGEYPQDAFFEDLARVSDYRADPDLLEVVMKLSTDTLMWMRDNGVRFLPPFGRRSFQDGEVTRFVSGAVIEASGGGPGLVEMLYRVADRSGIDTRYGARALSLLTGDSGVSGVRYSTPSGIREVRTKAVILSSGGFASNAAWRAAYLGKGWDLARVRGTPHNTGDGIKMALDLGASLAGNWSGCHSTPWELNAPEFGEQRAQRAFFRAHYHLGLMVNGRGQRFVDEGEDHPTYTYAKFGSAILDQPGHFAWQIFDSRVENLLGREEYRSGYATRVTAGTVEDLAQRLEGVDPDGFIRTVRDYNAAVDNSTTFNPAVLDGKSAQGLPIPKTNWATPIDKPPFEAFAVTAGITFTFGGLRVSPDTCEVLSDESPIGGLFAAGEIVGGLFYSNYAGGTGLTTGAVLGRQAGERATNLHHRR